MSKRDVTITLRQMLDYAQKAITLSRGRKRSDLDKKVLETRQAQQRRKEFEEKKEEKLIPKDNLVVTNNAVWLGRK